MGHAVTQHGDGVRTKLTELSRSRKGTAPRRGHLHNQSRRIQTALTKCGEELGWGAQAIMQWNQRYHDISSS